MTPEVAAGIISGGGIALSGITQGISSIFTANKQIKENAKNRDFAREQATTAYNRMLDFYNRDNAYNSPAAQMQRYISAGLNPNLVYGQPNTSMGSPSVPQGDAPSQPGPHYSFPLGNIGDAFMSAKLTQAQIDRLQTQNTNDTRMTDANVSRIAKENDVSDHQIREIESNVSLNVQRLSNLQQDLKNLQKQFEILDEEKKQAVFQSEFVEKTLEKRILAQNEQYDAVIKYAVIKAQAEVLNINADTALKKSQIKLNEKQMQVADQMAEYYRTAADTNVAQSGMLVEQAAKFAKDVDMADKRFILDCVSTGLDFFSDMAGNLTGALGAVARFVK